MKNKTKEIIDNAKRIQQVSQFTKMRIEIQDLNEANLHLHQENAQFRNKFTNHANVLTQRKMRLEAELFDIENLYKALTCGLMKKTEIDPPKIARWEKV